MKLIAMVAKRGNLGGSVYGLNTKASKRNSNNTDRESLISLTCMGFLQNFVERYIFASRITE